MSFTNIEYLGDDCLLLNPLIILESKIDKPNCDDAVFKIKNNLSELKTQFLKSEARKNLGIDNSLSITSKVTYNELVALRDKASLVSGMKYRITDYVTTTVQKDTKSANHQFDVIVEAVSENELSKLAQATQHEGDTYFDANDLESWQLWYDLDNDTTKYKWADTENGKGVIYRMIDEKRNDCPYDFKNILFFTNYTSNTTSDNYYYAFSYVVNGVLYDGTVEKKIAHCYNNSMGNNSTGVGKKSLSRNVFRNVIFTDSCYSNTFGYKCSSNTFGDNCYLNTFGDSCFSNKFGNGFHDNKFGNSCLSNAFGNSCFSNKFGDDFYLNTIGDYFYHNTIGVNCRSNKFGNSCLSNAFGNSCISNTFGDDLKNRTLNYKETAITLNEEFYDDGSGRLVPIKHPDLSTQPSILPYKFIGQYVYEQLIPVDSLVQDGGSFFIPKDFFLSKEIFVFDCAFVGFGYFLRGEVVPVSPQTSYFGDGYRVTGSYGANDSVHYKYIKIVYTSMPEEGGYYYNSESKKGILIKVNLLNTTPLALYNGDVSIEPVVQGQEYYYDIPDDYKAYSSGLSIESTSDVNNLTIECYIPDIGEARFLECDNTGFIELGELVDEAKQYLVTITIK